MPPADRPETVTWRGASGAERDASPGSAPPGSEAADGVPGPTRRRRVAVFAGLAALAGGVVVVVAAGADDGGSPTAPTSASTSPVPTDPTGAGAGSAGAGSAGVGSAGTGSAGAVNPPGGSRNPIDAGLRYGGAGGGADIRAVPTAEPLALLDDVPRLPDGVAEIAWSVVAAGLDGVDEGSVDVVAGGGVVVVAGIVDDAATIVGLAAADGAERWRRMTGDDDVRLLGTASGLVAIDTVVAGEVIDWLDLATGAPSDDIAAIDRAESSLSARASVARRLDAAAVGRLPLETASDADAITAATVERLESGGAAIITATEVAVGRLVLLVGSRVVGAATSDGGALDETTEGLVVDWSMPGVLVGATASDRGATLLVSDRRGAQFVAVDAASGSVVSELGGLQGALPTYTPLRDGVIVKRPALVGTSLVGVDLDGDVRWELLGSASFAVGDDALATVVADGGGVTVTLRR
ncbi:MAG: hypothetical protein AAGG08_07425 [Actinomycetota bacterium]